LPLALALALPLPLSLPLSPCLSVHLYFSLTRENDETAS